MPNNNQQKEILEKKIRKEAIDIVNSALGIINRAKEKNNKEIEKFNDLSLSFQESIEQWKNDSHSWEEFKKGCKKTLAEWKAVEGDDIWLTELKRLVLEILCEGLENINSLFPSEEEAKQIEEKYENHAEEIKKKAKEIIAKIEEKKEQIFAEKVKEVEEKNNKLLDNLSEENKQVVKQLMSNLAIQAGLNEQKLEDEDLNELNKSLTKQISDNKKNDSETKKCLHEIAEDLGIDEEEIEDEPTKKVAEFITKEIEILKENNEEREELFKELSEEKANSKSLTGQIKDKDAEIARLKTRNEKNDKSLGEFTESLLKIREQTEEATKEAFERGDKKARQELRNHINPRDEKNKPTIIKFAEKYGMKSREFVKEFTNKLLTTLEFSGSYDNMTPERLIIAVYSWWNGIKTNKLSSESKIQNLQKEIDYSKDEIENKSKNLSLELTKFNEVIKKQTKELDEKDSQISNLEDEVLNLKDEVEKLLREKEEKELERQNQDANYSTYTEINEQTTVTQTG